MGHPALVFLAMLFAAPSLLPAAARPSVEARGYRVRSYHWDAILAQQWAVLEDAVHPDRPLHAELVAPDRVLGAALTPASTILTTPPPLPKRLPLAVHSGDAVTLWADDKNVRMQLAAVAEGNAAIGERIQLRVTGAGVNGNTGWRVAGIVRGPGSVEMEQ